MIEYNLNPLRRQRLNDDGVNLSISKKPKKEGKLLDSTTTTATSAPAVEASSNSEPDPNKHEEGEREHPVKEIESYVAWPREIKYNDNSSGRGYEKMVDIVGSKRIYTSIGGDKCVNYWLVKMNTEELERVSKIPEIIALGPEPGPVDMSC